VTFRRNASVLVVDDTTANRFVVRRILENDGYRVAEAGSGSEMAAQIAINIPDLIVLDVRLPDANGYDLTARLKADPATQQVPILMLSASFTTDEAKAHGLDSGADGYLAHPVEPPVLLATVRSLLRARQTERRVTALYQTSAALGSTINIEQIGEVVVRSVLPSLGADAGGLIVIDQHDGAMTVVTLGGYDAAIMEGWRNRRIDPLDGTTPPLPLTDAIRTGEPVILRSTAEWAERYPAYTAQQMAAGYATSVVVPCRIDGRTLGALTLSFTTARAFDDDDVRFALAIGQQCAQAIERARLYQAAQRAQHAAETANRAKVDFLATMSHELRTPLNAIAGYAELIALGVRGPLTSEQRHDIERILRSQKHLLNLINEVLNYARLETGRLEYDLTDVAATAILESLDAFIAPQVRDKGIVYECQAGDGEIRLRGDVEKVQQILLNLLSNAIKFTPAGGRIQVRAEALGGEVAIRVSDTGRGIPGEKLESIFEPFVQVDRRLTSDQQGTGLGLSISRELARGMGGELTVESNPGSGSTFTLRLPAAAAAPAVPLI
jgi:signal transduction histidine kinase/CheY-like chemotaxis protein